MRQNLTTPHVPAQLQRLACTLRTFEYVLQLILKLLPDSSVAGIATRSNVFCGAVSRRVTVTHGTSPLPQRHIPLRHYNTFISTAVSELPISESGTKRRAVV
eukprot:3623779-Rhodomonas_salina.1